MADKTRGSKIKYRFPKKWLRPVAVLLALAVLLGGICYRYFSFVSHTVYQESTSHLSEILRKSNNMLSHLVSRNRMLLHLWNDFLKNASSEEQIRSSLNEMQGETGCAALYFLAADGSCMTPDGERVSLGSQTGLGTHLSDGEDVVVNAALPGKPQMLVFVCPEAKGTYRGFTYDAVAGHSLGEYAAMVAAGMLSLEDGFRVIKARAEAMDAAAKAADGAMCAILKLAPAEVEQICAETEGYVVPANYNSSVQTVIAGDRDAVEKAAAACAAKKARAVPLAVASAFHTKLMQPAADAFYAAIQNVTFAAPKVPFYSNVLGAVRTDFSDMPKALAEHIVSPVRFTDELAAMQAAGIDTFVEFGPKNVLTGLVKKTLKGVTAKNVENCATLEGALA